MKPADYNPFPPEVHDYVDGRMSSENEHDFERRVANDNELKKQVSSLQRTLAMLNDLPVKQPPEGFDEKVIGRIREEELADRARRQIALAPTPIWKYVVQIGIGAAAASVVFALFGIPGLFGLASGSSVQDEMPDLTAISVQPTEQDLLPALADQKARFESLRRNVANTRVDDPRAQRRLIALELEHSELTRRNVWLGDQLSGLPADKRVAYVGFIESLDAALASINAEITRSRTDNADVNVSKIVRALDSVDAPRGMIDGVTLSGSACGLFREDGMPISGTDGLDEIQVYSLVRQADYCHDDDAIVIAADVYLRLFGRGRFVDHAHVSAIGALIRQGKARQGALRFESAFGEYDEDLTSQQLELVRGMLDANEYQRLQTARKALRVSRDE